MAKLQKPGILYITYLGILEPIPKSQVLPYLYQLSEGAEIHLLSFEKKWLIKKDPGELKRIQNKLKEKGIIWHRLTYHKYPLLISSLADVLIGAVISFFILVRHKISILHCRSNVPIAIGYLLKLVTPIKLLYDRRGIMGEDHIEHSGWKKGGLLHRFACWFERKVILKSDSVVVLTDKANALLGSGLASKKNILIKTIPCCVDLDLFNRGDSRKLRQEMGIADRFIFIYSGSVGTYNLLNEMFDFFKAALRLIPEAHFLILTQNKDTVEGFLKNNPEINRSKITISYASSDKLPVFLSAGDAGLVFRRTSPTAIAASPTKLGEYLACGLPIISTPRIGDLDEIITSNEIGAVLTGYEESDYIQAVTKLLDLLKEKDALRARCRKTAEGIYSLECGVGIYRDIYNQLLSGKIKDDCRGAACCAQGKL